MKVTMRTSPEDAHIHFDISLPESWLIDNCEPLPGAIADQITLAMGTLIIEDAVIMAMGCRRKPAPPKSEVKNAS